jgi:3-hydroxyisobutyrate dehydrogenase-like beta-hydroxyacid dehydrogenase
MATIGFIGTGNIGNPMCRHIVQAGHDVVVHDRRPEANENLIELGARRASTPREVAEACRVIFSSLPGPKEVEDVVRGADGLLGALQPGDIHVDLSTNSVTAVRRMAELEAAVGVMYLDSPVTGGVAGAEAGTLTLLVSGDRLAFEEVEPVLKAIGTNIFYLGDTGTGTLVKLINNAIVLCAGQLMQEGVVLGAKAGLDPGQLYEMLRVSSARPFIGLMPQVIGRRFENPSFTLGLAAKDVGLAMETARDMAVPMPVTSAAHQTYLRAVAAGLSSVSFLATLEALEAGANTRVPKTELDRGTDRI